MKVLMVHNRYQIAGGEDSVVALPGGRLQDQRDEVGLGRGGVAASARAFGGHALGG